MYQDLLDLLKSINREAALGNLTDVGRSNLSLAVTKIIAKNKESLSLSLFLENNLITPDDFTDNIS